MKRVKELPIIERFQQQSNCPGALRLYADGFARFCSHKNDRVLTPLRRQLLQDTNTAHAGQMDIEHDAVAPRMRAVRQKLFARRIGQNVDIIGFQQYFKGITNRVIVIDDHDECSVTLVFAPVHGQKLKQVCDCNK